MTSARLMLSNSDPTELDPRDGLFKSLDGGYQFNRADASRMTNADEKKTQQDS